MANKESNFVERTGETVRNVGLIVALLGTIAYLARFPSQGIIFGGTGLAVAGEVTRRLSRSNK